MGNKVGKTCLEHSREVDTEKEDSDNNAIEEERNDILIVQKEEIIVQHKLEGYFMERHHFPKERKTKDREPTKNDKFIYKRKE